MSDLNKGTLIGVGVGPGDPELLTLKALRAIQSASAVSYLANESGQSQAKAIAIEAFAARTSEPMEIPVPMPMSLAREPANRAYDQGAQAIMAQLEQGRDVVFLCEGDPLFFGSFAYLLERIQPHYPCSVIPGISSVHAASAVLQQALTQQEESFAIVSGRHTDKQIATALSHHDTVVIMKAGVARPRILTLLQQTQRQQEAIYLEYIGRPQERVVRDISTLAPEKGPYFSLFVVTRRETLL